MQNIKLEYVLLDIEVWRHQKNKYPCPITFAMDLNSLIIGSKYSTTEYNRAEKEIWEYYNVRGYNAEIMNPLYQHNNTLETVLTIDLYSKKSNNPDLSRKSHLQTPKWFREVIAIINTHQRRTDSLYANGGNLGLERDDTIFFSKDPILRSIEQDVQKLCTDKTSDLINLVENGSIDAGIALQWIYKDPVLLENILYLLRKKLYRDCTNILLRQLITCITDMSQEMKILLTKTLVSLLQYGAPDVRNKALSILSDMDKTLLLLPDSCIAFIKEISNTKQLNCAYPAKEILEKLKTPEVCILRELGTT